MSFSFRSPGTPSDSTSFKDGMPCGHIRGVWEGRETERWGDEEMGKYLVMVEDGTFFYTELNGFDMIF
ncbi:hypothetical protein D4Z78_16585 [Okeania hirsuta]|nr:hypothetical protein D4Z78_16585 [Okeania hirsuta]